MTDLAVAAVPQAVAVAAVPQAVAVAAVPEAAARAVRLTALACSFQQSITSAAQAAPRCLLAGANSARGRKVQFELRAQAQSAAWQGDTPSAARRCARRRAGRFAALARGGDAGIAPRRARAPLPPGAQLEGRTSSPRESSAALARACRPQKAARCRQLCLRRGAHGARRGGRRRPLLRGRQRRSRLSLPAAQA